MAFTPFRWEALERLRDSLTEAQWDTVRIGAITAGIALVAGLGYWVGRPAWRRWQNHAALEQARTFGKEEDFRSMLLALRRATEMEPNDRATWEEVARDLDRIGSPEELGAQQQVIRLSPGVAGPRLDLAEQAMRFGRYDTARTALDGLDPAQRTDAAYHRLAAALAMAEGQPEEMKRQLAALVALAPNDANARFTYAALRLWGADTAEARAGLIEMQKLVQVPDARVRAALELIGYVARQRDPAAMDQLLKKLLTALDPAGAADTGDSDVRAWNLLVEALKQAAADSASDAALFARWLADLGRRPEALAWLDHLPAALSHASAPADMEAQLAAEADDFDRLKRELDDRAWGAWPAEVWTRAIAAHQEKEGPAAADWRSALAACGDSVGAFRNLARLATIWHEPTVAEEAWSAALDRDPSAHWAFEALRASYLQREDYSDLLAAYARQADRLPANESVAANWILWACLLDQTSAAVNARADNLSSATPLNIVAKAADLWRLERPEQAAEKLALLSADDRRDVQGSFWTAVIEADVGNVPDAAAALSDAERYPRDALEKQLLDAASLKIRAVHP